MSEVDTFDLASLEAFTSDLVAAGFEPESDTARRWWRGPAHHAFAPLTDAATMRICIRDGWPIVFPVIFIEGVHSNHLTEAGFVCLWHEGESSGAWISVAGFFSRITEWCLNAANGWDTNGLARDAYLNFTKKHAAVATFDLAELAIGAVGGWGAFHGVLQFPLHVDLKNGPRAGASELSGLWFHIGDIDVPPRNLAETREALNKTQRKGLDRALAQRGDAEVLSPTAGVDLVLFCWDRDDTSYVLPLALEGSGAEATLCALQPGPNDEASLLLRAGPDAANLREKSAVVFGLGALGGHAAVVLAESGLGRLRLVDADQLLPGNVVRHVIGHQGIAVPKAYAVKVRIADHAPWTKTDSVLEAPITPMRLRQLIDDVDLVIDATGNEAATQAIAAIALAMEKPLVSGALYRGGAIARIQRQGTPGDVPMRERKNDSAYRLIPPGDSDDETVESAIGCSAPINNAPPSSVLACAALIAQVAVDALTESCTLPDEVTDVYRTLPGEPPYDTIGRIVNKR